MAHPRQHQRGADSSPPRGIPLERLRAGREPDDAGDAAPFIDGEGHGAQSTRQARYRLGSPPQGPADRLGVTLANDDAGEIDSVSPIDRRPRKPRQRYDAGCQLILECDGPATTLTPTHDPSIIADGGGGALGAGEQAAEIDGGVSAGIRRGRLRGRGAAAQQERSQNGEPGGPRWPARL